MGSPVSAGASRGAGRRGPGDLVDEGVVADVMVAGLGLRKLESELVLSSPINFIKDGGGYVAIGNFPKGEHRGLIVLFFHVWVPATGGQLAGPF